MAFAVALLGSLPLVAYAESATPETPQESTTVRVGFFPDSTYMSQTSTGSFQGFNIDYLNEIAIHTNWDYEYIPYTSWVDAFNALKRGEVDILPSVHYIQERDNQALFSRSSVGEAYTTLNVRLDDTRYAYEDFENFEGMRVGVIEGSRDTQAYRDYSASKGFTTKVTTYKNSIDMLAALESRQIDALSMSDLGHVSNLKTVARFSPEPLYIAVSNTREDLYSELNQALETLRFRFPDFFSNLYKKYFGINTEQDPVFTKDEYQYLSNAPKLTVAYASFRMPLSYTDPSTGQFNGISASLYADITRITGLKFEFVPFESQRAVVEAVMSGEVDLAYSIDPYLEDPDNLVKKTGVYLSDPMATIVGSSTTRNRLALPAGFSLSDEIAQDNPTIEISYFDSPKLCFDAILENKADVAYADINVANYLLAEEQYRSLGILSLSDYTNSMAIGVATKNDPRLVSILDRCVQYTSEATKTKWITESTLNSHPTSPLDILRQYPLQIILTIIFLAALAIGTVLYIARSKTRNAKKISQLVNNDQLTGGWSFTKFQNEASLIISQEPEKKHAVIYIDINRFKSFNAAFGFAEGDHLLIDLHKLLGHFITEGECYARVSADQFVVLTQWRSMDDFNRRFDALDQKFNSLAVLQSHEYHMLLLAGVSVLSTRGEHTEQLLSEFIDCARYARESIGESSRSTAALYTDGMREQDIANRAMQTEAALALTRGEFVAYYQPKVEITTGKIDSFEALVRWDSPDKGLRAPGEFLPLFEKNGFITEIDFHIFTLVCQRIRECLDAGMPAPTIACNFSRLHLQNDSFPEILQGIVERYDIPIHLLELELTENMVMEDFLRAQTVCNSLKSIGFRLSIDDFGKGYSSLGALQDLPIDVLKLDRSFLTDSIVGSRSKTILEGVLSIAENLGMKIIVEGVETIEQATMLKAMNNKVIAQGFLYSRPVPRATSDEQLRQGFLKPL